jgi:hypothetical protein
VIPPKASAHFVIAMEDVLDVYARPHDPARPVVCVDEGGKRLIGDVREPLPARPGSPAKEGSEYRREGVANLFLAVEPLLVTDNLNTHCPVSLYETFDPEEARRLAARIEWHYTPKHGSWLNVAECELSTLARQCLDRRIPDLDTLRREVAAWERARNAAEVRIDWQFTTVDARSKLKRFYPSVQLQ